MSRFIVVLICVLPVTPRLSAGGPQRGLTAMPSTVDFGTFNTFEGKKALVTLRNTGRYPFAVEKIRADCSCIRVSLKSREIRPRAETTLEIEASQAAEGNFTHWVLLMPRDTEHCQPLRVGVKGRIVRPVVWTVGWPGKTPVICDTSQWTKMGIVHYSAVTPVVYVHEKAQRFDIRTSVVDVNSAHFVLDDYRFISRRSPAEDQGKKAEEHPCLVLRLAPKEAMKPGVLRDTVKINLAGNVNLRIPLACRVVGDVYADRQHVNLGNLNSPRSAVLSIRFVNNHARWEHVNWIGTGPLAEAITAEQVRDAEDDSSMQFQISLDNASLAGAPRGYVFSHLTFFEGRPTDEDAVTVLVDASRFDDAPLRSDD